MGHDDSDNLDQADFEAFIKVMRERFPRTQEVPPPAPDLTEFVPAPKGWASDKITNFLELGHRNTYGIAIAFPSYLEVFNGIHDVFEVLFENFKNNPYFHSSFLALRSHSAWLSCVKLAMSTQVPETYLMIRNALEYAVYAHYFKFHPEIGVLWASRNESEEKAKKVRNAMNFKRMVDYLAKQDTALARKVMHLYSYSIDVGAHPNIGGVSSSLEVIADEEGLEFYTEYYSGGDLTVKAALFFTSHAGILCLRLIEHVYPERMKILGNHLRLQRLEGKNNKLGHALFREIDE